MSEVLVETSGDGAVRTITLNRAEKRNALTREMFDVLTGAFEAEPPRALRVTLIRADGPVFCAGVDLGQRATNSSDAGTSPLELLCDAVYRHPLPVVAAVQGAAIGGGMMLALHCDVVVADAGARFQNAAVQMGLVPAWLPARRIAATAPAAVVRELLVLGQAITADRLAAAGVIAAAVPADELVAASARTVDRLAANAPLSLVAIKATVNVDAYVESSHELADSLIAAAQASDDVEEGALARREKRPPVFRGR